jgi:hypothetical protein
MEKLESNDTLQQLKDFVSSGPVIKAVAKVYDIQIPSIVPVIRAAGRSVSIADHYTDQYTDCRNSDHSSLECMVAGSAALLTESAHRAVGSMAIGTSVELAATGIGVLPATGLATAGFKVFTDSRDNGDLIHKHVLASFDDKPLIKPEKFILMGIPGISGEYMGSDKTSNNTNISKPMFKKLSLNFGYKSGQIRQHKKFKQPTKQPTKQNQSKQTSNSKITESAKQFVQKNPKQYVETVIRTENKSILNLEQTSQLLGVAYNILMMNGDYKVAKLALLTQNVLSLGIALSTGNVFSSIIGMVNLTLGLFGETEKSNDSSILLEIFSHIMDHLIKMETRIHQRFDNIDDKLQYINMTHYTELKKHTEDGKNIKLYLEEKFGYVDKKLANISMKLDNLNQYMKLMIDNISIFRIEKIDELITQIDYDIKTDRLDINMIHRYISLLKNIIDGLLVKTGNILLVNKFGKISDPTMFEVINQYTRFLLDLLPEKKQIHLDLINSLNQRQDEIIHYRDNLTRLDCIDINAEYQKLEAVILENIVDRNTKIYNNAMDTIKGFILHANFESMYDIYTKTHYYMTRGCRPNGNLICSRIYRHHNMANQWSNHNFLQYFTDINASRGWFQYCYHSERGWDTAYSCVCDGHQGVGFGGVVPTFNNFKIISSDIPSMIDKLKNYKQIKIKSLMEKYTSQSNILNDIFLPYIEVTYNKSVIMIPTSSLIRSDINNGHKYFNNLLKIKIDIRDIICVVCYDDYNIVFENTYQLPVKPISENTDIENVFDIIYGGEYAEDNNRLIITLKAGGTFFGHPTDVTYKYVYPINHESPVLNLSDDMNQTLIKHFEQKRNLVRKQVLGSEEYMNLIKQNEEIDKLNQMIDNF